MEYEILFFWIFYFILNKNERRILKNQKKCTIHINVGDSIAAIVHILTYKKNPGFVDLHHLCL